jgi:hypothetical protein
MPVAWVLGKSDGVSWWGHKAFFTHARGLVILEKPRDSLVSELDHDLVIEVIGVWRSCNNVVASEHGLKGGSCQSTIRC